VVLPGTENWQLPRGFLGLRTWVSFAAAGGIAGSPGQLQRLLAAIRQEHPDADTIRGTICPYKGLEAFAEEDAALFFGRDKETAELHRTIVAHRVAAMIGRSGTGKSSLVRAGLLPKLRQREATGWNTVWDSLIIRPGTSPLTELARVLSPGPAAENELDRFRRLERQAEELRHDRPDTLARFLRERMGRAKLHVNRLLIVVDQAEELFARPWHVRDAAEERQFRDDAEQFVRLLLGAAEGNSASVALTIRSDYFDPLMHSPFGPVLKDTLVQLGRIDDLRPSIERPAKTVGLTFSPGLVDQIIAEVGGDESNLPLLQHALQRTWELRAGAVLSANAYTESGGVAKAINQAAQACYDGLSPAEQAAAKRLFLRLVRPGEGNAHLRQRTPVPEDALERKVMEAFAAPDRRLLFVGMTAGRQEVEVAHEALVRGWPTLLGWVETSRERLRTRDDVLQWLRQPDTTPETMPALRLIQRAHDLLRDPGDVPVDDLRKIIERWVRRERWQRNRARMIGGVVILILSALSATAIVQWRSSVAATVRAEQERDHAERNLAVARDAASGLVFDLAQGLRDQTGVPVSAVRKILDRAMTVVDQLAASDPDDPALLRLRAAALDELSKTYESVGDTERQRSTAEQEVTIMDRLAKADPGNTGWQHDLSVTYTKVGDVLVAQGNLPEALTAYRDSLAIIDRLAKADPGNAGWQRDLSVSDEKVGNVLVAQGNLPEALKAHRDGLAIRDRLAKADPGNALWQRDLSVSYEKVGDVLMAQ
jgi:tetratricopeptide (TPR) repeat protein